jgi:hypothetical protein
MNLGNKESCSEIPIRPSGELLGKQSVGFSF